MQRRRVYETHEPKECEGKKIGYEPPDNLWAEVHTIESKGYHVILEEGRDEEESV